MQSYLDSSIPSSWRILETVVWEKNCVKFSETWLDYTPFVKQKNPDVSDLDNSLLTLPTTEADFVKSSW